MFIGLGLGITDICVQQTAWLNRGTPTPTPSISAPVITQTSTAGANPFLWTTAEDATFFPGYFWNVQTATSSANLTAGTTTADIIQQIEPGDLAGNTVTFTGLTTTSTPGTFAMRERVGIDNGMGGYTWGPWSNVPTDTIAAPAALWTYNAAPTFQAIGYGASSATFLNEHFLVGTGLIAVASDDGNVITGVTVGGSAATLIKKSSGSTHACSLWSIASASVANRTVVVTAAGAIKNVAIATGTLDPSINGTPSSTPVALADTANPDPLTTPSLTIPAGGIAICFVGSIGSGVAASWVAGSSNTEQHGANGDLGFATASRASVAGESFQFSVDNYNYSGAGMVAAAFGP